jgi:ribosomal protein S12 methylthiotransferase
MNRRGSGAEIRALFEKLRREIPGLVIRTSIIAGLPGEGEAEFEELCEFLEAGRDRKGGVFTYRRRKHSRRRERERVDSRNRRAKKRDPCRHTVPHHGRLQ